MRFPASFILLSLIILSILIPMTFTSNTHKSKTGIILVEAEENNDDNNPPLLKLIYPCWDVWGTDIIDVVVKAYDPDGLANISVGVPPLYMVPLTPMEYGNTTLYQVGLEGNIIFSIYGEILGHVAETANITVIAADTHGSETTVYFLLHRPDRTNPPVIIAIPRNGSHYVWGESFYFAGGFPVNYWPCPEYLGDQTSTYTPCSYNGTLNWIVTISLDNRELLSYSGGGYGGGWISGTYEAPHVETSELEPGTHNFSYSIDFDPINVVFKSVSVFYVDDPGTPTIYKVLDKQDMTVSIGEPNITITTPQLTAPTKIWVYTSTRNPGTSPPYTTIMGPILIVSNSTTRPGVLNIYFHLNPEDLQRMGITMRDLMPLAWDRDLDIWYPKGTYKIYEENYTVKMLTPYPFYGGGLYITLVSKASPIAPPKITILSPQQGVTLENETVSIKWTVENGTSKITKITLTIDGQQTINLPPSTDTYTLQLSPGTHEIIVQVEDEAGLHDAATLTITIANESSQNTTTSTNTSNRSLIAGTVIATIVAVIIIMVKLGIPKLGIQR